MDPRAMTPPNLWRAARPVIFHCDKFVFHDHRRAHHRQHLRGMYICFQFLCCPAFWAHFFHLTPHRATQYTVSWMSRPSLPRKNGHFEPLEVERAFGRHPQRLSLSLVWFFTDSAPSLPLNSRTFSDGYLRRLLAPQLGSTARWWRSRPIIDRYSVQEQNLPSPTLQKFLILEQYSRIYDHILMKFFWFFWFFWIFFFSFCASCVTHYGIWTRTHLRPLCWLCLLLAVLFIFSVLDWS